MTKETRQVHSKTISCEGNNKDGTGHPLVYLNMEKEFQVTCPYCSRFFVYEEQAQTKKLYLSSYPSPFPKESAPKI